jgi:hypothetical protein
MICDHCWHEIGHPLYFGYVMYDKDICCKCLSRKENDIEIARKEETKT